MLESSRYENLSIKGFASYLSNGLSGTGEIVFWLLLGVCLLAVLGYAYYRDSRGLNPYLLLICTIAALIIPSVSNDYKLSLLIPPVILFFCGLPEIENMPKKTFSILLVVLASLAYWTTLFPATVKPDILSRNFPALIIMMISVTALSFLAPNSYEGNLQKINDIPEPEK